MQGASGIYKTGDDGLCKARYFLNVSKQSEHNANRQQQTQNQKTSTKCTPTAHRTPNICV